MIELKTKISKVIQRTHNVKSFRIKEEEDIAFKAGQYMDVTLEVNGKEQTKSFSISSAPTEKGYFEFTKKITDSDFSKRLDGLQEGDPIRLSLPKGAFILNAQDKKVVFLSGGIGITPLRSMAKYATDKGLDVDITLLYGNQSEKDIAFREDLDACSRENDHFCVVYTLDSSNEKWQGRTGLINAQMIKEEIPDYQQRRFYLCGPPPMVKALGEVLSKELEVSDDRMTKEDFYGY